mmetsp:Transcript_69623/g.167073  ORF Transcript_69623/g.167073 Transcript_69623/m.167073 type:complete len:84 (-) Transcript_69623:6-257(-)
MLDATILFFYRDLLGTLSPAALARKHSAAGRVSRVDNRSSKSAAKLQLHTWMYVAHCNYRGTGCPRPIPSDNINISYQHASMS